MQEDGRGDSRVFDGWEKRSYLFGMKLGKDLGVVGRDGTRRG
jgi:hypothetical protein